MRWLRPPSQLMRCRERREEDLGRELEAHLVVHDSGYDVRGVAASCARDPKRCGCRCNPKRAPPWYSLVPDFDTTAMFPGVENSAGATAVSILTFWMPSSLGCTGPAPCGKAITAIPSMVGRIPTWLRVPLTIGVELFGTEAAPVVRVTNAYTP